jgi:hypothetical protein
VDELPFGYAFNFDNYLFNKLTHISTQGIEQRADFFIVNNIKKRIEGKIHFLLRDGVAYSPFKSLFGSFEFNPRIHPNLVYEFWIFIETNLKSRNIRQVKITNFAECYAPKKAAIIKNALEKAGFFIPLMAVNHHIKILEELLEKRMHAMEVRRLEKCRANGFIFAEEPAEKADEIFEYLQKCRKEQGLDLSITKEKLLEYQKLFPQNYTLFTVRKNSEILAATLAIKVHRKILYSFLPGSLRKFKSYSPTVMLNDGLYNYCQKQQMTMLDLGISTEKSGKDQKTLIAFKQRMGGEKSFKYFFEKTL